jgi:hypothetical protein
MGYAPHNILEGMAAVEAAAGDQLSITFEQSVWKGTKASIAEAVDFDFGNAVPERAHMEFADGLLDRGLFRLPFPEVLFRGRAMPHSAVLASQQPDSQFILICTTIGPVQSRDGSLNAMGPLLALGLKGTCLADMHVDWKSCTVSDHHSRKTGQPWAKDTYDEKTEMVLSWVCGLTALLMSKDIDVTTETPSPRLNRDRIAKGKPPIQESRVIRIRQHARDTQRLAFDDYRSGRSSPIIHWRRGHFRRIKDDVVVPIPPTIVGAREGVEPPAKKGYRI